jgi:integrase
VKVTSRTFSYFLAPSQHVPQEGKRARFIDLSDETIALLREHKRRQSEVKMRNRPHYHDDDWMFASESEHFGVLGVPLHRHTIDARLKRISRIANVKPITPHGLRHTCATLLLAAGISPHVVQRRLGHKKVEITLGTYAHVLPSQQADAAQRLASLLHGR